MRAEEAPAVTSMHAVLRDYEKGWSGTAALDTPKTMTTPFLADALADYWGDELEAELERERTEKRRAKRDNLRGAWCATLEWVARNARDKLDLDHTGYKLRRFLTSVNTVDRAAPYSILHEQMIELLHRVRFGRDRMFEGASHHAYKSLVEAAVNSWSPEHHSELTNLIAGTLDTGYDERLALIEAEKKADFERRAHEHAERQRLKREERERRAREASDPVDTVPDDLLDALGSNIEQIAHSAATQGVW